MSLRAARIASFSATSISAAQSIPNTRAAQVFDAGLLAFFLGLTFLLGVFPLKDTDFWWHLRTGDLIRQTGWVPSVDSFTYGAEGHPWVDLHWVFQLLVSAGFERFGVAGLNVAKCVVTTVAVLLLVTSGRKGWPTWATLLAWVPAILVLGGRMYLRPETLTLLYLATDIAILARWDKRPWLAFALPVVQLFWVNTQGLFVFGPFLVAVALADAATRLGAFGADRRGWWRTTLVASATTVLVCLANPYGLRGATYPIELLGTMGNPIFRRSIGELKPLSTLYAEIGFNSLPLVLHLVTMALGALSFLVPALWRTIVGLEDRGRLRLELPDGAETKPTTKAKKPRKPSSRQPTTQLDLDHRPLRWFRLVLFLTFSGLSLLATRNSHQFAAVVGTVTSWNFAEWAAAVASRRRRLAAERPITSNVWPKGVTLAALVLTVGAVGSGQFYAWCQEGRTVGLGEEPLWFPHAAVKFAGGPGMPDRLVGFHNGHPSLFEYYWGPDKKVYTDARLEVMGPEVYQEYLNLQRKISVDQSGWSDELDKMGRPSVLIDTVDPSNGSMVATLLNARHWRCVWFDSIVAIFVHDSYAAIVKAHGVDFLARHYHAEAEAATDDPASLLAMTRSLRGVATPLRSHGGGETKARALIWLGLDYARRLRALNPLGLDGFKQAGLLDYLRDPFSSEQAIPRYRLPFDPTIDLPLVTTAYELNHALEVDPDDGISLWSLASLNMMRGMDESAIPLLERFSRQPNKNLTQQEAKAKVIDQIAELHRKLGPAPATSWKNLSELEQVFDRLSRSGRAAGAVEVVEVAHRDEARPWSWANRLATIRLHLGQPARAREIWRKAADAPAALQAARIAATYLVEGDFASARKSYSEAVASDLTLFEAHFGLVSLEQAAGRAEAVIQSAQLADQFAPNDRCRGLVRQVITETSPYLR